MTNAEGILQQFFEQNPNGRFSRREISRKAVRRSIFEEDPRWADDALNALVAKEVVEVDNAGYYMFVKRYDS